MTLRAVRCRTDARGAGRDHARMKNPVGPLTAIYTEWLDTIRGILPGWHPAAPSSESTAKQAQVSANQEWEDEGGSIRTADNTAAQPGPKIPF
jgi:hypothetical protein